MMLVNASWRRHVTGIVVGVILLLSGVLLATYSYPAEAASPFLRIQDGRAIFQQKCASCHTIGGGRLAGPDLKGVTALRDRAWLVRFIASPDEMIAERDPTAIQLLQEYNNIPMPDMGLSDAEVASVVDYLTSEGGAPGATGQQAGQTGAPAVSGDPNIGKALFTGSVAFENGGSPCIACHSIAGLGQLGGGVMGGDLTQVYNQYGGAQGIGFALAELPFPTMKPIYDSRPLTPEEQASLASFLQASAQGSASQQPVDNTLYVVLLTIGGLAVLLLLMQAVWRRRLGMVRGKLAQRPRKTGGTAR